MLFQIFFDQMTLIVCIRTYSCRVYLKHVERWGLLCRLELAPLRDCNSYLTFAIEVDYHRSTVEISHDSNLMVDCSEEV